jgi:hypothetical protein
MLGISKLICDFRYILKCLTATFVLVASSIPGSADELPTERSDTMPAAGIVSGLFHGILEVAFVNQSAANSPARIDALKLVLAQAIDASEIGRFILGRYAHASQPSVASQPIGDPGSDFLDFAAHQIMRMAPASDRMAMTDSLPSLTISNTIDRPDQTHMVLSELVWPDGHRLPLTWELADHPGAGLRIKDVSCLGISLRLMLRSAVAEAAAEHPEKRADLAGLLNAGNAFGRLPGSVPGSAPPTQ